MNQTFVTDITHFLDEQGNIPKTLPTPAKKLVEFLGSIVADVSKNPRFDYQKVGIQCWSMSHRGCCPGIIEAGIELDNFNIVWYCPKCKDNGVISNWKDTFYDCSDAKCH